MMHFLETTTIDAPAGRCFDLSRSVDVHLLSNVHSGEQALAAGGRSSGLIEAGETVVWRARHFFVWQDLTSRLTISEPPHGQRDGLLQFTMTRGIFRSMQAEHHFRALPDGRTEMRDDFRVLAPLGWLGRLAEWLFLRRYMLRLLRERNRVIRQVAEDGSWRRYLPTDDGETRRAGVAA